MKRLAFRVPGALLACSLSLLAAVPAGALPPDPVPAVITVSDCGDGITMDVRPRRNPEALGTGKAMDRLELDRLIKRMEKLNQERQELQTKIDAIDRELDEVRSRADELQTR